MNKLIYTIAALAIIVSCGKKDGYVSIQGECSADSVFLFTESAKGVEYAAAVKDGKYLIKGNVTQAENATVADSRTLSKAKYVVAMFLESGEIVISPAGNGEWDVTGTPANDAFAKFVKRERELNVEYLKAASERNFAAIDSLQKVHNDFAIQFARENMSNYAGLYTLSRLSSQFSREETLSLLEQCPESLRQHKEWKALKESN